MIEQNVLLRDTKIQSMSNFGVTQRSVLTRKIVYYYKVGLY